MAGPERLVARQPVSIILYRIACPLPLSSVEGDQRRQREGQARRQRAMRLLPCQQLRQNTGAVLGHAVESDRQQLMFDIGIAEAPGHGAGE